MTALSALIETGTRDEIARAYADEIIARDGSLLHGSPWVEWNAGIVERFSMTTLVKIKREAWRLVDEHER